MRLLRAAPVAAGLLLAGCASVNAPPAQSAASSANAQFAKVGGAYIAASSGIQHVFTFTIASLVVGFVVALFLKETAPRKLEAVAA